ncbi:sugar-binding protein, partial [Pseudomonas urmiensis]
PSLPLALFFNPLNQQDTGYGKGWNLQLSQFTPDTQVVALHTGESFKVTSRNGVKMLMEEKKLDSFHMDEITNGASTHYLVEHSSGLLEKLQTHAASQPVALPVEVWTRQTRPLKVTYAPFVSDGDTYDRLASIEGSDVEGVYTPLLEIKRDESTRQVQITLNPQGAAATQVRFVMQLDTQGRVIELQLPTVDGNQTKWRFTYTVSHTYNCLAEVRTPTGAW